MKFSTPSDNTKKEEHGPQKKSVMLLANSATNVLHFIIWWTLWLVINNIKETNLHLAEAVAVVEEVELSKFEEL